MTTRVDQEQDRTTENSKAPDQTKWDALSQCATDITASIFRIVNGIVSILGIFVGIVEQIGTAIKKHVAIFIEIVAEIIIGILNEVKDGVLSVVHKVIIIVKHLLSIFVYLFKQVKHRGESGDIDGAIPIIIGTIIDFFAFVRGYLRKTYSTMLGNTGANDQKNLELVQNDWAGRPKAAGSPPCAPCGHHALCSGNPMVWLNDGLDDLCPPNIRDAAQQARDARSRASQAKLTFEHSILDNVQRAACAASEAVHVAESPNGDKKSHGVLQVGHLDYRGEIRWVGGDANPKSEPHGFGALYEGPYQIFRGEFRGGVQHGFGLETGHGGERYEGQYHLGRREGLGRLSSEGRVYVGHFVNNVPSGYGIKTFSSRHNAGWFQHEGFFSDGHAQGPGVRFSAEGGQKIGRFKDDRLKGPGIKITRAQQAPILGEWDGERLVRSIG